jgi:hypothetical protein
MMKTEKQAQPSHPNPAARPTQDEIQAAYQVHTLAQMLYGRMAMTHPWLGSSLPVSGAPQTCQGFHGYHAFQEAPPTTPWTMPYQGYPITWGFPRHHWIW